MNQTLGSLVAARPTLGPFFDTLGLDYCCGGHRSLEEAARTRGLDPSTLKLLLDALPEDTLTPRSVGRPAALPTPELIDHVVAVHHSFVRRELPRLVTLAARSAQAHGDAHPELFEVETGARRLSEALLGHLSAEEDELFPKLRDGSVPSQEFLAPYFGEHEEAGALLARFRHLTHDFSPPDDACATYRELLAGLAAFEADLHEHVHLENNVLFARLV
jgi:regulator of cell morphogenesis and NO signaling